jgi:hypothetical protein
VKECDWISTCAIPLATVESNRGFADLEPRKCLQSMLPWHAAGLVLLTSVKAFPRPYISLGAP